MGPRMCPGGQEAAFYMRKWVGLMCDKEMVDDLGFQGVISEAFFVRIIRVKVCYRLELYS
jgi:hypothetical protein